MTVRHLFLSCPVWLNMLLLLLAACLQAVPIEVKNASFSLVIQPERGGRIVAITTAKGNKLSLLPTSAEHATVQGTGMAGERIVGDGFCYINATYRVMSHTSSQAVLYRDPMPVCPQLAIKKTLSVLPLGRTVKVTVDYINTEPDRGTIQIIPWIHNAFLSAGKEDSFTQPHSEGFSVDRPTPGVSASLARKAGGNWMLYRNTKTLTGLLLICANAYPDVVYNYLSPTLSTLEMFLPVVVLKKQCRYTYYLTFQDPSANEPLPQAMNPPMPPPGKLKENTGKILSLENYFRYRTATSGPLDVRFWKSRIWLSPDVTLPLVFGIRNRCGAKNLELEVDLPDGLELKGAMGGYWHIRGEEMTPISAIPMSVSGKQIMRHRFKVQARLTNDDHWLDSHCRLLVRARHTTGSFQVQYRLRQGKKLVANHQAEGEIIRIPKAQTPRNFKFLMGIDYSLYHHWKDVHDTLHHLGINGLCFNYNVPNKAVSAEQVWTMNERLKKKGFMTAMMGQFFNPPGYLTGHYSQDLMAVDRHGKPTGKFDFTARGPWMQDVVDRAIKWMSLGYDLSISDYEPVFGGAQISFTQRTISQFRRFMSSRHPTVTPWIDPTIFVTKPALYPEHNRLWIEFKCDRLVDYLEQVIADARDIVPQASLGWCNIAGSSDSSIRQDNLMDTSRFMRVLDVANPMLYNNRYQTMCNYRNQLELFQHFIHESGKKVKLMPTLTAGFRGENNSFPPTHTFNLIVETALLQADGIYLWPGFAGTDNANLKEISQALNLVAHLEPDIADTKRADHLVRVIRSRNTILEQPVMVRPLVLAKGPRAWIYLAEYSHEPVTVELCFKIPSPCMMNIKDDKTGKCTIQPGDRKTFRLEPQKKKYMILELKRMDGMNIQTNLSDNARQKNDARKDVKIPRNRLFYENFDGPMNGCNQTENHGFSLAECGLRGKCLYYHDYQAAWAIPHRLPVKSGNVTVELFYLTPQKITHGKNSHTTLFTCRLDNKRTAWLFFHATTGALRFAVSDRPKEKIAWPTIMDSKTEKWTGNCWRQIRLTFGKSGILLKVDGKTEMRCEKPIELKEISGFQLGRRWQSFGYFDELSILDGTTEHFQ